MREHKHLIVRAVVSAPPTGDDLEWVKTWLRDLVEKLEMKVLRDPEAVYCRDEGNRGVTASVLITTSHVVMHTWDEPDPGVLQLDVYTCSDLPINRVIDSLDDFSPTGYDWKLIDRSEGLRVIGDGRV